MVEIGTGQSLMKDTGIIREMRCDDDDDEKTQDVKRNQILWFPSFSRS